METKIYRIIIILFSVIVGIAACVFCFFSEKAQLALNDPLTQEHIDFLKEISLEIAKTMDDESAKENDLKSTKYYSKEHVFVVVESNKTKITAKFPISNQEIKLENGSVFIKGSPQIEKIQFEQEDKIMTKGNCIFSILGIGVLIGLTNALCLKELICQRYEAAAKKQRIWKN